MVFFSVHTKRVNILWLTPAHSLTALSYGQWSLWYIPHHLAVPIKVQPQCCGEALVVCSITNYSWRANLSNQKVTFQEVRRLQATYKMLPVGFAVICIVIEQTQRNISDMISFSFPCSHLSSHMNNKLLLCTPHQISWPKMKTAAFRYLQFSQEGSEFSKPLQAILLKPTLSSSKHTGQDLKCHIE